MITISDQERSLIFIPVLVLLMLGDAVGVRFAICNELFQGWNLEKTFDFIAKLGYEGLEIAPFTLADDVRKIAKSDREHIRELSESYGVAVAGIHWILVTPPGLHITHPDPSVRRKTKEYMMELIRFNADIGGKIIVFGSPKQRNVLPGVSKEKAWKYAREIFQDCSRFAEDYGVVICIEPLARHLTNFINTAEEAIRLIEEVAHPNFRLILDVYSMCDEGKPIDEIIRSSREYLAHFHANDDNKLGPGFGGVDYYSIAKALKEIGYQGYVSVEVFDFSPGSEFIARKSIENLRKFFGR